MTNPDGTEIEVAEVAGNGSSVTFWKVDRGLHWPVLDTERHFPNSSASEATRKESAGIIVNWLSQFSK